MSEAGSDSLSASIQSHLRGRPIVIFGLGREGKASETFIRSVISDSSPLLVDDHPPSTGDDTILSSDQALEQLATMNEPGILIKTPGIPSEHPLVREAQRIGWQIHSNTSLFFQLIHQIVPGIKIIGITGTKGKSTTTSLIFHLLQTAQIPSRLTGNIGTPPLQTLLAISDLPADEREKLQFVVFELSSHQLRELKQSPEIAIVLQISPEHLDYYPDFSSYLEAKAAICAYQKPEDVVIFNPDFPAVVRLTDRSPARRLLVSPQPRPGTEYAASQVDHLLYAGKHPIIPVRDLPLIGEHNLHNVLPSLALANELQLDPSVVAAAIHSFQPLAHRLNLVEVRAGISYYNDSQATNPEAAIAALRSFPDSTIHLIAGGSDKGLDLTPFAQEILKQRVATVAVLPPMGDVIKNLIENHQTADNQIKIISCTSMSEAVATLTTEAKSGDVVLLSPACASFGMFKDYQDRGNQFIEAVRALG